MRYAQFIMGPAGSGKSTYCSTIVKHGQASRRTINVVNLDPAAEYFDYPITADIRDLIHLDDAMQDQDLQFGPNGGLIFCMEYLAQNLDWFQEQLGDYDNDYILFDCPGQIELYTHLPVMKQLIEALQNWDFRICCVFILDAHFMIEGSKFVSGTLAALSAMVTLETPHVNVISKTDLLNKTARKQIEKYLEPDVHLLLEEEHSRGWGEKYAKLSEMIGKLIDDYSLVKFMALDITNENSINDLLLTIDNAIQFGEDEDVHVRDFDQPDPDEDPNEDLKDRAYPFGED